MSLHIYKCANPVRTRAMCPHHKHLCYGVLQEFYDTRRISFDCGTFVDYGYGYYEPPKLYNHITIFKDDKGYTAWCPRSGWKILANRVSLQKARSVASKRLKVGGHIKENI